MVIHAYKCAKWDAGDKVNDLPVLTSYLVIGLRPVNVNELAHAALALIRLVIVHLATCGCVKYCVFSFIYGLLSVILDGEKVFSLRNYMPSTHPKLGGRLH